jgi:hypothetical protein
MFESQFRMVVISTKPKGDTMTVQDISTNVISRLRIPAQRGRHGILPVDYTYACAGNGDIARGDDRMKDRGMASVPKFTQERRKARRHARQLLAIMSIFNRDDLFSAQMVNYSQDGVCVETCQCILPGTSLHMRIDASPATAVGSVAGDCFRTTSLGEVKWCRALGQHPSPRYLVGIRYYSYY